MVIVFEKVREGFAMVEKMECFCKEGDSVRGYEDIERKEMNFDNSRYIKVHFKESENQ